MNVPGVKQAAFVVSFQESLSHAAETLQLAEQIHLSENELAKGNETYDENFASSTS